MARRRKATRDLVVLPGSDAPGTDGADEQLLVRSSKVASHAVKAQKETRRAARAERKLAKAERKAIGDAAYRAALEAGSEPGANGTGAVPAGKGGKKDKDPVGSELTGAKVKRYLAVARLLIPVLAPIVYQAAGAARAQWDEQRARRLGVAPDELSSFSGRGTGLYARIHHLAVSTRDLRSRRGERSDGGSGRGERSDGGNSRGERSDGGQGRGEGGGDAAEVRAFADDADARLADLESAVRAAEQMPAARRRAAHVAVDAELDRLESRLLALWGLAHTPGSSRLP